MIWPQNYITVKTKKQRYEVADVFRQFETAYRQQYQLSAQQARVVAALKSCRTAALGGHINRCLACGAVEYHYHSCRDRHCPKCEKFRRAQWIEKQKVALLPIPYFHVTFTTDHALNRLFAANRRLMYEALFWAASETLKRMGIEQLGGQIGVTAVLHTWGQKLDPHVHLHCIVTGGALSKDGSRFNKSKAKYLCDVVALSAEYRKRLLRRIKRLWKGGQLRIPSGLDMAGLLQELGAKKWEVFCKAFEQAEAVYNYLSKYVHQVAISNYRIRKIEQGQVYFEYHDNKDEGKQKVARLNGVEFMRRFLWHVVPQGFRRIRHYGLHHASVRRRLSQARHCLGLSRVVPEAKKLELKEWLAEVLGEEALKEICAHCGAEGTLSRWRAFSQLSWLELVLFSLLGLNQYGTPKG